ncbi:MAG TPA: ribosome biogenesis factor YjgA [Steroidobacteraceae bacterium]
MFEGLDLAQAHPDRQARVLADGSFGLGRPASPGLIQRTLDNRLKVSLGKAHEGIGPGHRNSSLGNPNGDSTGPSDSMGNMTRENDVQDSGETEEQRLSKSARKREAASLQELGVKLSALPDQEIKALDLPENLFIALRDLRRLPSHGAQVRQRQYIGKLMRNIDPEPVLAKLAERKQQHDVEIRHFQQIERWRDRLLSEPAVALGELLEEYPKADRATLTRLLEKAEKERLEQRSPVGARELFAFLRQLLG